MKECNVNSTRRSICLAFILLIFSASCSNAQFQWAKGMGSALDDSGHSVKVDGSGNVYTTGYFQGTVDFDPGVGTLNFTSNGSADIFISKLDASGNLIWAKQIGGSFFDESNSMALDQNGNIYLCGIFFGTVDFDPGVATFDLISSGFSHDVFILKLDGAGNFVWAKAVGGPNTDEGIALALDADNNVYATGYFSGTADFDPGSGTFNLSSASPDVFICKLNENGNFGWAKQLGGNGTDNAISLAIDANANIYTTGFFESSIDLDPDIGISSIISAGNTDVFVSTLDSSGNYVNGFGIGGSGFDYCNSIIVDISGSIYVCGFFDSSADFDPGSGVFILNSIGGNDVFIAKYQSNGNLVWAKNVGGLSDDRSYSIALDASGNVFTCGSFSGTTDFDPGTGIYTLTSAGSTDIFISKLDNSGNFLMALHMGGSDGDAAYSITIDPFNNIYTTGDFKGTADFDPEFGTFNLTSSGSFDVFISKIGGNLTGIDNELESGHYVTVFPNPNSGDFSLIIPNSDHYSLGIYTQQGQLIHHLVRVAGQALSLNLNLEPGFYYYSLERNFNGTPCKSGKIIVQ